uniref:Uncharacterized protein n=1 Tax=Rhizophora mucronata TaxID=61149 RepID=A0A2P2KVJ3_RHIMU
MSLLLFTFGNDSVVGESCASSLLHLMPFMARGYFLFHYPGSSQDLTVKCA